MEKFLQLGVEGEMFMANRPLTGRTKKRGNNKVFFPRLNF